MKVFKTSFRASHNALAALTLFLGLPLASIDKDVSDFKSGLDNKSMQKNFADASRKGGDARSQQLGTYYSARYLERKYELTQGEQMVQAPRADLGQAINWFENFS